MRILTPQKGEARPDNAADHLRNSDFATTDIQSQFPDRRAFAIRPLNLLLQDRQFEHAKCAPDIKALASNRPKRTCMKAAVVPAVSSSWQIKDVPQPQLGPGQVLVKMHASGICYTDVHQTLGHAPGQFPRILGHEPVGEIVAVAPDVPTRKVGDRVGSAWIQSTCGRCEWCQRGRRMFCPYLKSTGVNVQGGHAEYMPMNAEATYLIPEKVSYEQAAPIFCAGYTVYSGLRWADPQPHERVAVLGIGGLG